MTKSSKVFISKSGKNTIHFTVHRLLFTDYCSLITIHGLLFMTLFTPKFCLFKGGCPLNFRGFSSQVLVLISLLLELAFLEREPTLLLLLLPCSPLFTTSLVILQTL